MLQDIWNHRGLIRSIVLREFQIRSVRALWGTLWLVLQPAAMIFIYTAIFGRVLGAKMPGGSDKLSYGLFVCTGLITWGFFTELALRGQNLFLEHAPLLRALRFPRSTLPISLLVIAAINFGIVASIFLVALLLSDRWPGLVLLGAVPVLALQSLLGLGLGVLIGTANVFFRDAGQIVQVVLQFWFWLTPIVYPVTIVPEAYRGLLAWNPMLPVISSYQRIVLDGAWPDWRQLLPMALVALLVSGLAWLSFRRLAPDLVDEL